MRPVRLELEGFGAFVERTVIDLDDVEVFALVGPTGAGKSTVLDAMCFALYGSVPRYDDQRLVGAAMSLGANETRVGFTFDAAGVRYEAVRVVRRGRDGKVTTKDARLEQVGGPTLAGRASEMTEAVIRVVGLPFEHFTRCVVLPQGAFARFLHDKPADRQQMLVQLLDLGLYERLAAEANRRARAADQEAQVAARSAQRLAHATAEAVAAATERVEELDRLAIVVDDLAGALAEAEQAGRAAAGLQAARAAELAALDAVVVPEHLGAHRAAMAEAARTVGSAAAALVDAEAALEAAVADRRGFGDVTAAAAAVRLATARPARQHDVDRRRAEAAAATRARAASAARAEVAEADHRAAAGALEVARVASAAHAVREHLVAGSVCPVCEQAVVVVPDRPAPPAWQEARDALQRADAERERAVRAVHEADRAVAGADAGVSAAVDALAALDAELAAAGGLAAAEARLAKAAWLDAAVDAADAAVRSARAAQVRAEGAARAARAAVEALAAGYHRQRDAVAALEPPPPTDDVAADWAALVAWAHQVRPEVAARWSRAVDAGAEAARTIDALATTVTAALAAAGIASPGRTPGVAVTRALAEAEAARDALGRDLADRAAEERAAAESAERAQVARVLAQLLSASGFERWLVAEATEALVASASVTLGRLSGGQYALALDASGELSVVDHTNAGERRSVRTLSGGETFQAALALALALADQLRELSARSGASLDSLFLDEGFGTLDPDSLEVVAASLENLGGQGRMVGIITHVRELAARLPVRFEVTRGPRGAVVRREAG